MLMTFLEPQGWLQEAERPHIRAPSGVQGDIPYAYTAAVPAQRVGWSSSTQGFSPAADENRTLLHSRSQSHRQGAERYRHRNLIVHRSGYNNSQMGARPSRIEPLQIDIC